MEHSCLLLLLPLLCLGLAQETHDYWLKVQELLEVQEGLCAHVPCNFYHSQLTLDNWVFAYWFHEGADVLNDKPVATNNRQRAVAIYDNGRFHLLGDLRARNCSLSISNARSWDQGRYFFRVERGHVKHSYKDKELQIRVTALTQKPSIQVFEPLVSGRTGRLICSLPGACEQKWLKFSWAGEMFHPHTTTSQEFSFTPGPQDHGRNLSCQVTLMRTGKSMERTIRLNVSYAPQNLTTHVSFRAASELGGQNVQLLCRADSNPPAKITWLPRSPGKVTTTQNTATLELHFAKAQEDAQFICQAWNHLGSQTVSVSVSVFSPPKLLGPHCNWEAQTLHCICSALGKPVPALHWWLGPELLPGNCSEASIQLNSSTSEHWTNSSLNLLRALDAGHILSCEASNVYGAQRSSILLLPGRPQLLSAAVPGALGVAGALVLLSLCICFIIVTCIVRVRRKSVAAGSKSVASEDPAMDPASWNLRQNHSPDTHPDQATPDLVDSQELHYANLSFHWTKPKESQQPTTSGSTEYSEIRPCK